MAEVGGLWAVPHWQMSRQERLSRHDEIIDEIRQRGVRALETDIVDEALVEAVPDLEFLSAGIPDGRLVAKFRRLRLLGLDSFEGSLDFRDLPRLEWLGIRECEPGNLDGLLAGHPKVHGLAVGRYPFADLTPLARLHLGRLSIGAGRRLSSLEGAASLAATLTSLDLYSLPSLASLDGIEALENLEVLELGGLRHITTLDWVRRLPRLRLLNVFDLKNVEGLGPLAGHPGLEFVIFGRTKDLDLEPLADIPNLRLMHTGSYRWNRDRHAFPYLSDLPPDHPVRQEYLRLLHG